MDELAKMRRVCKTKRTCPHHSWLVIDGSTGTNGLEQAKVFHQKFGLTGLVVTKLDGTAKGGALVSIYRELELPIYFIGLGESPEDLQPLIEYYLIFPTPCRRNHRLGITGMQLEMEEGKNRQLEVRLGERTYPITIGSGLGDLLLEERSRFLSQGRKVVAVFDEGLVEANPDFCHEFRTGTPCFSTPSGESTKSIDCLAGLWDFLSGQKVDRSSVLFAVGGGVTGDLAGFAAASYLRGISFHQVPTTLLAMVDSSVEARRVSTFRRAKTWSAPFISQRVCLWTWIACEPFLFANFRLGWRRSSNMECWEILAFMRNSQVAPFLLATSPELQEIILRCCTDKARIVEEDEKETNRGGGGRALLNLGHTLAHAIEAVSGYGTYLHGEAVAIEWFRPEAFPNAGACSDDDEGTLIELLRSYELPVALEQNLPLSDLMEVMESDKKVIEGKLRFVLMKEIGVSQVVGEVDRRDAEFV